MKAISILPRHNVISLSTKNTIESLQTNPTPQIFPLSTASVQEQLTQVYPSEAALVQYVLVQAANGEDVPMTLRLKRESLTLLDPSELYVEMRWVILDWDLPSKGVAWEDPSKPETKEQIAKFIESHPRLKYAYAYYFSKSGVRIMFALQNPLKIIDNVDVLVWKSFFTNFIKALDISEIGGELENKSDPFTLNRVPRYTKPEGGLVKGEVIFRNIDKPIKVAFPARETLERQEALREAKKKEAASSHVKLPSGPVKDLLWNEPLICFLRETHAELCYQDWRAIGTNVAALLGDVEGREIFDIISQWDTRNYDASAVASQWPHILNSAQEYGPTTWSQFKLDLSKIYEHHNPRSSLASHIRRAVGDAQLGHTSTLQDNTAEVTSHLLTTTKSKNGQTVVTPNTCPTNLHTILTLDNMWKDRIRRNHLGSVDMMGDAYVQDEDVTAIRERVSRVYGLKYSRDEIWETIKMIALDNEFHPVADYLTSLTWDGQDRIADLAKALGQDGTFSHTILHKFLISCVVRPLEWNNHGGHVNWKIDTVFILKGHQGKRKSSFFKALCADEEWFSDNLPSITHERKDASLHMMGKWLVEQAEFEGHVARSSVEMMKAFITREREIFRKPYGRAEVNMRRPSVLVGTTNSSSFLNDPTGDRRFWVLEIPKDRMIDLKWVHTNRDQLWAQAVDAYRKGEIWWLTEDEARQSNRLNERFRRPDALAEAIMEYVQTEPKMYGLTKDTRYEDEIGFTLKNLAMMGLDKKLSDLKTYEAQNITSHLTDLGFVKVRARVDGQRMYVFRKLKDFEDEEIL